MKFPNQSTDCKVPLLIFLQNNGATNRGRIDLERQTQFPDFRLFDTVPGMYVSYKSYKGSEELPITEQNIYLKKFVGRYVCLEVPWVPQLSNQFTKSLDEQMHVITGCG